MNGITHHALITGGSRGIGLGLAARLLARGDRVLVTGRSTRLLAETAEAHPGLQTFAGDLSNPADREALAAHVRESMPGLDLLVNNAGIQRRVALAEDNAPWAERQAEIDTLLAAPAHLDHLLIPVLLAHGRPAAIIEVTSGGALIPQPFAPLYSACKAALHSYSMTLRHALAGTPCRVIELMPPAVATELAVPDNTHGAPVDDFCDAALAGIDAALAGGPQVIGYGPTATDEITQRLQSEQATFDNSTARFPVTTY
ncbi:SDR family NAD(P)-dependent oxidoreductase [Kribbella sp. NPDC051718]|uniref:SDR family oxidoreductase n=1 Tax=Kribbella sp. NPDC051718 TaxID=3155168 RepID=UPI00341398C6